jgi:hypothetical protein
MIRLFINYTFIIYLFLWLDSTTTVEQLGVGTHGAVAAPPHCARHDLSPQLRWPRRPCPSRHRI